MNLINNLFKMAILTIPLILKGCETIPTSELLPDTSKVFNYKPVEQSYPVDGVGQIKTVSVGDALLEQKHGRIVITQAILIKPNSKIKDMDFNTLPEKYYTVKKSGEDDQNEYFRLDQPNNNIIIQISKTGKPTCLFFYSYGPYRFMCNKVENDSFKYERKELIDDAVNSNNFQQTLIYNGKVGNVINIGYREFSDNTARAAFSNEANYDLNESKIIAYKGASIEIISANNQNITFKILKNFN